MYEVNNVITGLALVSYHDQYLRLGLYDFRRGSRITQTVRPVHGLSHFDGAGDVVYIILHVRLLLNSISDPSTAAT